MKKDKIKQRKKLKKTRQQNNIRRLRYYLFIGMAAGFMYTGAAQVHAEEVKQPTIVSQANTSQSAEQTASSVDPAPASSVANINVSKNNTAKDINTADTNNTNNNSSTEINNSEISNSGANASTNTGNNSDSNTAQENTLQPKEAAKVEAANTQQTVSQPEIEYKTHIQGKGWETQERTNGQVSGTIGEGRRMEAISINITGHNNEIQYQVHVQDIGWMDYVPGGQTAGTIGQSKRIEAIRIRLTGDLANTYNVVYRTHVQNYGWMKWVMNDAVSGTTGKNLRVEAIKILLSKKDAKAPTGNDVVYDSHVQNIGWQKPVKDGQVSGTVGQSKRVEAFHVNLQNQTIAGQILYQAHVAGIGWQNWVSNGQMAGTTGQARQVEAIRLKLDGAISEMYDIYYRVHVQDYGWLDWTTTGQAAGTEGLSKRIEALELLMVARDQAKPTSNSTVSFIDNLKTIDYIDTKTGVNYVNDGKKQVVSRNDGTMVRHIYKYGNTIYVIDSDGVVSSSRPYSPSAVNYMSQLDSRWARRYFGNWNISQSGCVGTVSAMILDSLLNANFTPVDTCGYYWNGGYYNHNNLAGTTANGIPVLMNEYGLTIQGNLTYSNVVAALQSGKLIAADVKNMKYGLGCQHEILLKGYSNGKVYVYDPYDGRINGWASLQDIWNHRSYWSTGGGGPFFAIS